MDLVYNGLRVEFSVRKKGDNMKILTGLLLAVLILMASCSTVMLIENPMEESIPEYISVRAPVLKYSLIETLYEIYRANILIPDQIASAYAVPVDGYADHYSWLIETYQELNSDAQDTLVELFEITNPWTLMNLTTRLADDATIEEIVDLLTSSEADLDDGTKSLIAFLFPRFYNNYFAAYFEKNVKQFIPLAEEMTAEALKRENIIRFMEEQSGLSLGDKAVVLYYSLQAAGAWSFNHGDLMISTIQRNVVSFDLLYHTPLHEFTHDLYRKFIDSQEFYQLFHDLFVRNWGFAVHWYNQPSLYTVYSWWAFCEENLVEGFAKLLRERYYTNVEHRRVYYYDLDFYSYLKEIAFDSSQHSLEEISVDFFRSVLR